MISLKNTYRAIGLMSGTSLDGLDVVAATFKLEDQKWRFEIEAFDCLPYNSKWWSKLKKLHLASISEYIQADADYGMYLAESVQEFISKHQLKGTFDVIGSHGHTILHEPKKGFSLQLGAGSQLAHRTKIPVVYNLRAADVAAGGQGAPIVPIGERHLFRDANLFLNIGGIANIAIHQKENVIAYDVCPGNTPLNLLVRKIGLDYDKNGALAKTGVIDEDLLHDLESFSFYKKSIPRSLHTDLIVRDFMSIVHASKIEIKDKLATICEHIAMQIGKAIQPFNLNSNEQLLVSGGGAKNQFLIERIQQHIQPKVMLPSEIIIDYKEALVMAFYAVLRLRNEQNCIRSVTGASKDVCGGEISLP